MLKISLLFKKLRTSWGNTREFLGLRTRRYQRDTIGSTFCICITSPRLYLIYNISTKQLEMKLLKTYRNILLYQGIKKVKQTSRQL